MRKHKICIFTALLSLTLAACGKEISHTKLIANLSRNHIVHTLGGERPALLVLPADHDPKTPIPLVLSLHGFTSDSAQHDRYFGLSKRVNVDRFALIMANGTRDPDDNRFWNATDFCCDLHNTQVDDVQYLSRLLEEAATHIAVERIFAFGSLQRRLYVLPPRLRRHSGISRHCQPRRHFLSATPPVAPSHPRSQCCKFTAQPTRSSPTTAARVKMSTPAQKKSRCAGPHSPAATSPIQKPFPRSTSTKVLDGPETVRTRYRTGCRHDVTIELWTMEQGSHVPHFAPDFGQRLLEWLFNASRADTLS